MKKTAATVAKLDFSKLKIEDNVPVAPRTANAQAHEAFALLAKMSVGQSIRFPREMFRCFVSAKTSLKETGKVFIFRNIDKYNSRVWRVEDGRVLITPRKKTK